MAQEYQVCTRCIMDTTDPEIYFDAQGVCNLCHSYDRQVAHEIMTGESGRQHLEKLVSKIKNSGRRKAYDCIIGVSGGVDSTYVAYEVKKLGLRPLAVHLDNGWDSELAVKNIEQVLKRMEIDLYTHVLDWEEFKDLQIAFLKASTPDSEIPSDHAIWAVLESMAEKVGVRFIITGQNVRTETHLPRAWSQGHYDWRYIKNIHKLFGKIRLRTFPHDNWFTYYRRKVTLSRVHILNFLDYRKQEVMPFLEKELGWRYYGAKHHESIYTRFYQGYILPVKFGYDKRRCHLSALVCSGEITREAALKEMEKTSYSQAMQEEDRSYVIKKLGLTDAEFETIMHLPKKSFWDYPSYERILKGPLLVKLYDSLRKINNWRLQRRDAKRK